LVYVPLLAALQAPLRDSLRISKQFRNRNSQKFGAFLALCRTLCHGALSALANGHFLNTGVCCLRCVAY
jgi:hypothetical protein